MSMVILKQSQFSPLLNLCHIFKLLFFIYVESDKKSSKPAVVPRLHAGMISAPQTDLRHTGHVGYDGAVFGDIAFIGNNYERLPVKVCTPRERALSNTVVLVFNAHVMAFAFRTTFAFRKLTVMRWSS